MPLAALRRLFEPDVAVSVLTDFSQADPLLDAEREAVARAVHKRREEYAAGRTCARRALAAAGCPGWPALPSLKDRRAAWPAGFVGSITHTRGLAAAAVIRAETAQGIGLDAEQRNRLERNLHTQIAIAEEVAWIRAAGEAQECDRATALFSAKEAFYKAQYTLSETFLGFREVRYVPRGEGFEIELLRDVPHLGRAGARFQGTLGWTQEHVLSSVTLRRRRKVRAPPRSF